MQRDGARQKDSRTAKTSPVFQKRSCTAPQGCVAALWDCRWEGASAVQRGVLLKTFCWGGGLGDVHRTGAVGLGAELESRKAVKLWPM